MRRTMALLFFFIPLCSAANIHSASGNDNMVVTAQHLATQTGENILKQGGNAIDAAVAVGYALAVVHPCCGNIGGGGFMLIRFANGKSTVINFRTKAPLAAKASLLKNPIKSYAAVGVPGSVLGLNTALKKYGTMPLQKVMQPAIQLAEKGYQLEQGDINFLDFGKKYFQHKNTKAIFTKGNTSYKKGNVLVQKNLANTLQLIANNGSKAFYQGLIADKVVMASKKHNGIISKQDFANYTIEEEKPLVCHYRGYDIITTPPPSAGGITLCEILRLVEKYPLTKLGYHSIAETHNTIEAMRFTFLDQNKLLGDPDFVRNPTQQLLSDKNIDNIYKTISSEKTASVNYPLTVSHEGEHTTHFSIVDRFGNAVAMTYSINDFFGAKIIAGNTGFFLNNDMNDFSDDFKDANFIAPGRRPLSYMTPTIITKDNKLFMVLGTPGGPTIPTILVQIIQNVIDYHKSLEEAVNASHFHMQAYPNIVYEEPHTFSWKIHRQLAKMGYHFITGSPLGFRYWGGVAAILKDPQTGQLKGVMDKRRPAGLALGQ